jgi:hypothetical protein
VRALTVSEIIRLWETAYRHHPVDRALAMLGTVLPDHSRDQLAALTLGQRDSLLLSLRRSTFGNMLPGTSDCPACTGTVEFELDCSALQAGEAEPGPRQLSLDGYQVTVRPLDSFDLAEAINAGSSPESRDVLLGRCVSNARSGEEAVALEALPQEIEKRIADAALAADAQAETLLELDCPDCGHNWQSVLDIGQVLWLEISARAQRLLMEVHVLARAYGWREAEIFELSPERRAAYLQMVAA